MSRYATESNEGSGSCKEIREVYHTGQTFCWTVLSCATLLPHHQHYQMLLTGQCIQFFFSTVTIKMNHSQDQDQSYRVITYNNIGMDFVTDI